MKKNRSNNIVIVKRLKIIQKIIQKKLDMGILLSYLCTRFQPQIIVWFF